MKLEQYTVILGIFVNCIGTPVFIAPVVIRTGSLNGLPLGLIFTCYLIPQRLVFIPIGVHAASGRDVTQKLVRVL